MLEWILATAIELLSLRIIELGAAETGALPVLGTGWGFASVKKVTDLTDGVTKPVMDAFDRCLHMTGLLFATETLQTCRDRWQGTLIVLLQRNEEP